MTYRNKSASLIGTIENLKEFASTLDHVLNEGEATWVGEVNHAALNALGATR